MIKKILLIYSATCLLFTAQPSSSWAVDACGPLSPAEEQLQKLQSESLLLNARIKELESKRTVSEEQIQRMKITQLKEIAREVAQQRQSIEYFKSFVSWMTGNLANYTQYIKAGSYAAIVTRMLPIPYAGQASVFTKFAAQFTIALNNASVAINSYLTSSQTYITMAESLAPDNKGDSAKVREVSDFANNVLIKDMNDTQSKLTAVSELSAGALSFLETINQYMSSGDEYWNKAKGMLGKEVDPKEKSLISQSTNALRNSAVAFNATLVNFAETTKKQGVRVKSVTVYDELLTSIK